MPRLPTLPPSPTQSHSLSVQDGTERESSFDTVTESNTAPSIAQDSLRHIFTTALRNPGNTPQKARRGCNSIDANEVRQVQKSRKELIILVMKDTLYLISLSEIGGFQLPPHHYRKVQTLSQRHPSFLVHGWSLLLSRSRCQIPS